MHALITLSQTDIIAQVRVRPFYQANFFASMHALITFSQTDIIAQARIFFIKQTFFAHARPNLFHK
jgi:hypothetical protein